MLTKSNELAFSMRADCRNVIWPARSDWIGLTPIEPSLDKSNPHLPPHSLDHLAVNSTIIRPRGSVKLQMGCCSELRNDLLPLLLHVSGQVIQFVWIRSSTPAFPA